VRLWDVVPVAREAVLASMRDAVLVVDGTGRVADLNAAAEELLERAAERVIGRPVEEIFPAWSRLAATFPRATWRAPSWSSRCAERAAASTRP